MYKFERCWEDYLRDWKGKVLNVNVFDFFYRPIFNKRAKQMVQKPNQVKIKSFIVTNWVQIRQKMSW